MRANLDLLLSEGIIDEVLGRLKSGKEAEVFRVRYRGQVVAAKVYKDRQQRSFQHNVAYKEGRKVRNSRTQRAIDKGSRFGRDEAEDAWKSSEASTLQLLHRQGVRVPTPVLFYEGVLLMELVQDADGDIAPRLIETEIDPEQAGPLYRDLRGQIIRVLCCELIHGDLSPYNVLLGASGPTIIDFPQAISAAHNSQSEAFFHRDFENILEFFAASDRRLSAHAGDAREIWRAYTRRELSPDFVPVVRPPPRYAPPQQHWGRGDQRSRGGDPRSNVPYEGQRAPQERAPYEGQREPYEGQRTPQQQQGARYEAPRAPQQQQRGPEPQRSPQHGAPHEAPRAQPQHGARYEAPRAQQQQRGPEAQRAPQQGAPHEAQRAQQQQRGLEAQRAPQQQSAPYEGQRPQHQQRVAEGQPPRWREARGNAASGGEAQRPRGGGPPFERIPRPGPGRPEPVIEHRRQPPRSNPPPDARGGADGSPALPDGDHSPDRGEPRASEQHRDARRSGSRRS